MKVIDLLNKIANGEEVHFYIIDKGFKMEYFYEKGKPLRYDNDEDVEWRISEDWLNCEVEIIEDKKIEKLIFDKDCTCEWNFGEVYEKINEIIDYINGGTNGE